MTSPSETSPSERLPAAGVVFDTGPLLCFGHIAGGIKMIRSRYYGRGSWAVAVEQEIAHHSRSGKSAAIKESAARWKGPLGTWLGKPKEVVDRTAVDNMRARVQAASSRQPKPGGDLGESETLVIAQDEGLVALANENAARVVAQNLNIPAYCTFDVLVAEFKEDKLQFRQLQRMHEELREAGLDHGGDVSLPLVLRNIKRWRSVAPD